MPGGSKETDRDPDAAHRDDPGHADYSHPPWIVLLRRIRRRASDIWALGVMLY